MSQASAFQAKIELNQKRKPPSKLQLVIGKLEELGDSSVKDFYTALSNTEISGTHIIDAIRELTGITVVRSTITTWRQKRVWEDQ